MTDRVRESDRRREILEREALQAEDRLRTAEQELERCSTTSSSNIMKKYVLTYIK